jgi:hypothetical protein
VGGSSVSYRPAGSEMLRLAQSRRSASPAVEAGDVHVGEVAGRHARPRRPLQVGGLRVQLDPPGGLIVPLPHPGRGAEERAGQLVLGEPVQLSSRGLGGAQGLTERGREVAQHTDFGSARRGVPSRLVPTFPTERSSLLRSGQLIRILGGRCLGGGALGLTDHVLDLVGADAGPGYDAGRGCRPGP